MTMMNEDETQQNSCHDMEPNVNQHNRYLPDIVPNAMNYTTITNNSQGFPEYDRCLTMKTNDNSGNKPRFLDCTSLFSCQNGNMNGCVENAEMTTLCEQLGSVEMDDVQQKSECFNNTKFSERTQHNNHVSADFDSPTVYSTDKDGDTLLHTAIILRERESVMLLILKAASNGWLSFKNVLFQTPLHLAVLTDQPEVTRRLVIAGAEVDARDRDGNTALHIACREGQLRNVQNLLEPVRYHESKQITYEIPYQTIPQDLSLKNYESLSCLHLAATYGHLDIVEALLDKDIDVNLKEGKTGRTILHNACLSGDINLVKLLLRHRACNINARAFDKSTPFDLARARGHENVSMVLAAAGARYGEEFSESDYS